MLTNLSCLGLFSPFREYSHFLWIPIPNTRQVLWPQTALPDRPSEVCFHYSVCKVSLRSIKMPLFHKYLIASAHKCTIDWVYSGLHACSVSWHWPCCPFRKQVTFELWPNVKLIKPRYIFYRYGAQIRKRSRFSKWKNLSHRMINHGIIDYISRNRLFLSLVN
jgi:hypothetical protein